MMIKLLGVLLLLLFCLVCLKFVTRKPKQYIDFGEPYPQFQTEDINIGVTYDEYKRVLEWQFQMGIINAIEYNDYLNQGEIFLSAY